MNESSDVFNTSTASPDDYILHLITDPSVNSSLYSTNMETLPSNSTEFVNDIPSYLRISCLILLLTIFIVGTLGNVLVIVVISSSRDMRTSTNIYLVNLSVADLQVLLVCTPTALIEILYHPDIWILGFHMCKFVPLLESTVFNVSVLTILAISFERYYAICQPLEANYVCTRARALCMCVSAWIIGAVVTSPMFAIIKYEPLDHSEKNTFSTGYCYLESDIFADIYSLVTLACLFIIPFVVIVVAYVKIARTLTEDPANLIASSTPRADQDESNIELSYKARKQVVYMLSAVVFTFFLCHLPFRGLTLLVIVSDLSFLSSHREAYFCILYFARIMIYINSAINPLLYGFISSKFRYSLFQLCSKTKKVGPFHRHGTVCTSLTPTNSTNLSINGTACVRQISCPAVNGQLLVASANGRDILTTGGGGGGNNINNLNLSHHDKGRMRLLSINGCIKSSSSSNSYFHQKMKQCQFIHRQSSSSNGSTSSGSQNGGDNYTNLIVSTTNGSPPVNNLKSNVIKGDEVTNFLCENETHAHHYSRAGYGVKMNTGVNNEGGKFCRGENNNSGERDDESNGGTMGFGSTNELVKSDSIFCAYIAGKRDETIL